MISYSNWRIRFCEVFKKKCWATFFAFHFLKVVLLFNFKNECLVLKDFHNCLNFMSKWPFFIWKMLLKMLRKTKYFNSTFPITWPSLTKLNQIKYKCNQAADMKILCWILWKTSEHFSKLWRCIKFKVKKTKQKKMKKRKSKMVSECSFITHSLLCRPIKINRFCFFFISEFHFISNNHNFCCSQWISCVW